MAVISNTTARRIVERPVPDLSHLSPDDLAATQNWLSQLREAARDGLHIEVTPEVAAALTRAGIVWNPEH